jgi:histidine ammonia-lyase
MITLSLDRVLTLDETLSIGLGEEVAVTEVALAEIDRRREQIVRVISERPHPSYGFNRGFGHNVDHAVSPEGMEKLQLNFIRSHSCGVGPNAPEPIVRMTMLLRVQSFLRGHSAVRSNLISLIVTLLNHQITPSVPSFGSVGASGDLAPLSHIALTLIGEGNVWYRGQLRPTAEVFRSLQITPVTLQMKEGLALSNGMQFTLAYGIYVHHQLSRLLKAATFISAFTTQVMLGSDDPFGIEFQELRPHPGACKIAFWLNEYSANSPIRESHRAYHVDGEVQDPYNIRCTPQILGAAAELLDDAKATFEIEANSATDNPLILKECETNTWTRIVSGGHFHGMPLATRLYGLIQAGSIICSLSNTRCSRYVDESRNKGLGNDLIWPTLPADERSQSSGMMIAEYVSAALTNLILGFTTPNHLYPISTDAGQEDHVSMATNLALKLFDMIPRITELLAIELLFAYQGALIRKKLAHLPSKHTVGTDHSEEVQRFTALMKEKALSTLGPEFEVSLKIKATKSIPASETEFSPPCEEMIKKLGAIVAPITNDRSLSEDIQKIAAFISSSPEFSV